MAHIDKAPKITVVMNCLNGERFVKEAIESVYEQKYDDWEIVFWDNASTDGTAEIAHTFDQRLRYFRSDATVPLGKARQFAFKQARGAWIALLDHDDRMLPNRLISQMAAIEKGDYVLSYGGYREVDESGHLLRTVIPRHKSGNLLNELLENFEINIATTLMRRSYLEQIEVEKIDTFVMADEYYFCLKLAAMGSVCVVPETVAEYRQVRGSWSERTTGRHGAEFHATIEQLCKDNPEIERTCRTGLALARARADYSVAQHLMRVGEYGLARATLNRIRKVRRAFLVLYLVSFSPPLWRLIHLRGLKVMLTKAFVRN